MSKASEESLRAGQISDFADYRGRSGICVGDGEIKERRNSRAPVVERRFHLWNQETTDF
jgi:hypothetical protein